MSQWEQWFRDFLDRWFNGLLTGLGNVDAGTRSQILKHVQSVDSEKMNLQSFAKVWKDSNDLDKVREMISNSLKSIEDLDSETQIFFKDWFKHLMKGFEKYDDDVKKKVLASTGKMCSESFALSQFEKAWKQTGRLDSFLTILNETMGEGEELYRLEGEKTIHATYPKCYCPLVGFGLVESPIICNCSTSWLETSFGKTLGKEVQVEKLGSVKNGDLSCRFIVRL